VPAGQPRRADAPPDRVFLDAGTRRILSVGFIGRRTELHRLRRKVRQGQRVFVLQGLGGLGKSTLALHTLRAILHAGNDLCTLWCQDAEKAATPEGIAEALVGQLLENCRRRFGLDWEGVVQQVDRAAGGDAAQRFGMFLKVLVENAERLVVYLDNLESLLVGPEEVGSAVPDALGQWSTPALQAIWATLKDFAQHSGKVVLVASCRYRNDDFGKAVVPVGPLPAGALFRLMGWFPGLRRLSIASRARLVAELDGHPRAVEFANDLIVDALDAWEEKTGREWTLSAEATTEDPAREWTEVVEPALPKVEAKLGDDLLFREIWDRVLDERAQRMLYRMTLLRQPWDLALERELGEPGEPAETGEATAQGLRRTSLLEQVELMLKDGIVRQDTIHPATAQFVARRFGDDLVLRQEAHSRIGAFYEARARTSLYIDDNIEAGHHLFQAGEFDRAIEMMGPASQWLRHRGRVREGLQVLEPFLAETVRHAITPEKAGRLLGTVGLAYDRLGQVERAVRYHEQAVVIAREIGDRQGEGAALGNLGLAYCDWGLAELAIRYYEQSLEIAREIGDRQGEGAALARVSYLARCVSLSA
jgi:tetratricopeptide (TPR) repeat protein